MALMVSSKDDWESECYDSEGLLFDFREVEIVGLVV